MQGCDGAGKRERVVLHKGTQSFGHSLHAVAAQKRDARAGDTLAGSAGLREEGTQTFRFKGCILNSEPEMSLPASSSFSVTFFVEEQHPLESQSPVCKIQFA